MNKHDVPEQVIQNMCMSIPPSTLVQLFDGKITPLSCYPKYLKDKNGWPIERVNGQPVRNILRIVIQNVRKVI
jgi:hypothetical protein